jgi:arsenite methyltransferase
MSQDTCAPADPAIVRQIVRKRYAEAVEGMEAAGASGPSAPATGCCTKQESPAAVGARTTFGCGDPLAMAGILPGQSVLDVGSGPGADAIAAAKLVGPAGRVIGVDMTGPMLERARRAAAEEGLANVTFLEGDAESLPLPDVSMDWVISNCVVNLVPDKERAFAEIFRVLRPGGRFSITDLVGENLPAALLNDPSAYCACLTGAPSEAKYLEAIRRAGFENVEVAGRFAWDSPELEGTGGTVWSLKLAGRRPEA